MPRLEMVKLPPENSSSFNFPDCAFPTRSFILADTEDSDIAITPQTIGVTSPASRPPQQRYQHDAIAGYDRLHDVNLRYFYQGCRAFDGHIIDTDFHVIGDAAFMVACNQLVQFDVHIR